MSNLKTPAKATRDLTVDLLLERIQNNFRTLRLDSIDEHELKTDLEDLVVGLKEIGEELMTEYQWLKELLEEIRSEDGKARLLDRLQLDHEERLETRTRIHALKCLVDDTENVVEVVYKITSSRNLLGRLQNPSAQRSMSQSLSKISVAQEKAFEGRRGLIELSGELDRRGFEAKLHEGDAPTTSADGSEIERSTTDAEVPARTGSSSDDIPLRTETRLTREAPSSDRPARVQKPDVARSGQKTEAANQTPRAKKPLDGQEAPAAVKKPVVQKAPAADRTPLSAVNTPSETDPRPGNTPSPATARPSFAIPTPRKPAASGQTTPDNDKTKNRSRAKPHSDDNRSMTPATADSSSVLSRSDIELAKQELNNWSRWNLLAPVNLGNAVHVVGATPEEATMIRIQSLVGERKWRGELSRAHATPHLKKGESLWDLPASPPSQFVSATEEGDYCETSYRPRHVEHLLYSGQLPSALLREVTGNELLQEDLSACKDGVVEAGLEERCFRTLSKWSIPNEVSEHFNVLQSENDEDSKDEPAARMVRSALSVESIPIVRLECELELKGGRHYLVNAWLFGDEGKLHVGDVPKVWTGKTTAWLAAVATVGIPLGFLMARLV